MGTTYFSALKIPITVRAIMPLRKKTRKKNRKRKQVYNLKI